jgi:hypothetical protein
MATAAKIRRALSFREACRRYPHRFTMEHVPAWARAPYYHTKAKRYVGYAPQFRTDREWYDNTTFPGDEGHPEFSGSDCHTSGQTWPLGRGFLEQPYRKGQPAALAIQTP